MPQLDNLILLTICIKSSLFFWILYMIIGKYIIAKLNIIFYFRKLINNVIIFNNKLLLNTLYYENIYFNNFFLQIFNNKNIMQAFVLYYKKSLIIFLLLNIYISKIFNINFKIYNILIYQYDKFCTYIKRIKK